ncbi:MULTISPECIES: hypothetical protein [unclassified Sphingomonas]|uniref:DUF6894 family protein n=1 Tax=unclassified Sphingomonas TaxID=196159 RepID=UPI00226A91C5|nr:MULTISPECIES: hypothetical protein [unclassified Sphingomonas]
MIFYLHIHTQNAVIFDNEGIDLPNFAAAKAEAIRGARSMMCSEVLVGELDLDQKIEIHAPADHCLGTVEFTDALSIRGDRDRVAHRHVNA